MALDMRNWNLDQSVESKSVTHSTLVDLCQSVVSKWTQVIPNARLCKAVLDRITDRAHIIETGSESYVFRRTLEQRQRGRQRGTDEAVA